MALFAGAYISNRFLAFLIPAAAMLLADACMGFNGWYFTEQTVAVYFTYMLITALGFTLQNNKSALRVGAVSITSSVLFFVLTNFFTWTGGYFHTPQLYSMNMTGLMECYVAAIPFFRNTVLSDLVYNAVLFGGFYLLLVNVPALQKERAGN